MQDIGVIIPFYGAKHKLFRTLESVAKQTLAPDIVVLIDDCGPDPLTKEDELHWQGRMPQLVCLYNEHNLGAGFTRNVGMDCLEGKVAYLHFLDSDDAISDNFYESLVSVLNQNVPCVAAFSKTIYQNSRGDINPEMKETSLYDGLFRYRPWATSSLLWRFDNLKHIRWIHLKSCEDTIFELTVAQLADVIVGVTDAVIYVDQVNDEETRKERKKADAVEQYKNRLKLNHFGINNIPKQVWFNNGNVNIFVRRNIDLNFDKALLKALLLSVSNISRLSLVGLMIVRYTYLKIAIGIYNFGK